MVKKALEHPLTLNSLHLIRGLAAIGIVLFHLQNELSSRLNYKFLGGVFSTSYSGVDIFFVLSGFVLFYLYGSKIGKTGEIRSFLIKRALRLYPLYLVAVGAIIAGLFIFKTHLFSTFSFTLPFIFQTISLFSHDLRIIPPSWTLTYELYFYLLFSLIFLTKNKKALAVGAAAYSLVIFIAAMWGTQFFSEIRVGHSAATVMQVILGIYNIEFFMGITAAYLLNNSFLHNRRKVILATGVILFIISTIANAYLRISGTFFEEFRFIYFGFPAVLIIYGCAAVELARKCSFSDILAFPGKISFSLYLTHYVIIQLVVVKLITLTNTYKSEFTSFGIGIVTLCIVFIVSIFFYFIIENNISKIIHLSPPQT